MASGKGGLADLGRRFAQDKGVYPLVAIGLGGVGWFGYTTIRKGSKFDLSHGGKMEQLYDVDKDKINTVGRTQADAKKSIVEDEKQHATKKQEEHRGSQLAARKLNTSNQKE